MIELKINAILELLLSEQSGKAVDLGIVLGLKPAPISVKGKSGMANKKATGPAVTVQCFSAKGGKKMVMPALVLTDPLPKSITLESLDASGNVIVLQPTDNVTGTLVSDSPNYVIGAGTDSVHYTGTIPANTPFGSVVNLAATENGTIGGAAVNNLTSSLQLTLNIPPNPLAVDMAIIFA